MELSGQALSFCVHGEQSATNNARLHGESGLQALAINAAPCGYCRQLLYELTTATRDCNILLKTNTDPNNYDYTSNPLTYYLPDAFGPADLGINGGLMDPEAHGLTIASSDPAAIAALNSANACYAPYTSDFSGIAIVEGSGNVFTGRYAENSAYIQVCLP
jgi:cytidine deaminase